MSGIPFKLGDKVVILAGAHADREGYVVAILCDGENTEPDSITVRLYDGSQTDLVVAPDDARKL